MLPTDSPSHRFRPSRRAAIAAGAWSVPAIIATSSSPAFASSPRAMLTIEAPASIVVGVPGTVTVQLIEAGRLDGVDIRVQVGGALTLVSGETDRTLATDGTGRITFDVVGQERGVVVASVVGLPGVVAEAEIEVTDALTVGDSYSDLVLRVQPKATVAAALENRGYPHSDLQPTGRFARSGDDLTLTTERGDAELAVGLWGIHAGFNGGANVGVVVVEGSGRGVGVKAPLDGMVYVVHSGAAPQSARVSGGVAVPTFTSGRTSLTGFRQQLARRSTAPFVELISDRVFGTFRYQTVAPHADRVPAAVADWDTVVAETDRVYGLRSDYGGVAHKHANRVHIANPDTGSGYASATSYRITFQNDTGAGEDLFRLAQSGLWGLWHEIGHTYQTPQYRWSGLGEVTVNISSLARQEVGGWASNLDTSKYRSMLAQFRSAPIGSREYDAIDDVFLKVLMFDQLRRAFGEDFYPRLNQEYRVGRAAGVLVGEPRQAFMRMAARIAGRNLSRFFAEWGLAADAETAAAFARYPSFDAPIWDSVDRRTDPRVDGVATYSVPDGSISSASPTVVLGQSEPPAIALDALHDSLPTRAVARDRDIVAIVGSPLAARVVAVIRNSAGVPNALLLPASLERGTSFEFQGWGDHAAAWIALAPEGGRLRAGSTNDYAQMHASFAGKQYFAVTVTAPDGTQVVRAQGNGDENAERFALALDGTPLPDGSVLTVEHREPVRLLRWDAGAKQQSSTAATQKYRVEAGRLFAV